MSTYSGLYQGNVKPSLVPQSRPLGAATVKNRAGGFVFSVDCWGQLDRWLIIGSENATYYANAKDATFENVKCLEACLKEDGPGTVAVIAAISESGRAVKQDPAIYALAVAAASAELDTKRAALAAMPRVCRTGTHLFSFVEDVQKLRGWGPAIRKAVASWYNDKPADSVAYQAVKYQQRNGWSHKDLLRLSHARTSDPQHNALYRWIVAGMDGFENYKHRPIKESANNLPAIVTAFEAAKRISNVRDVVKLIETFDLPHEAIMNEFKDAPEVWAALLPKMGATALLRNLGKMSKIGMFNSSTPELQIAVSKLNDREYLRKGRVHPMSVLLAMHQYQQGRGRLGSSTWPVSSKIVDALDAAFYNSFGNVVPTGKRVLLAVDVSGSMSSSPCGDGGISARAAAAAMSMSFVRSEKDVTCVSFDGGYSPNSMWNNRRNDGDKCSPLDISPRRRLDDIIKTMNGLSFGNTDCALPFLHAAKTGMDIDAVVTMTDNESWSGSVHTFVALENLQQKLGHSVAFAACAFTATAYSVANEAEANQMNFVGLDGSLPNVLSDFIRNCPSGKE